MVNRIAINDWIKYLGTAQELRNVDPSPAISRMSTKFDYGVNVVLYSEETVAWLKKHAISFSAYDCYAK